MSCAPQPVLANSYETLEHIGDIPHLSVNYACEAPVAV